jgi:hypothetical protein
MVRKRYNQERGVEIGIERTISQEEVGQKNKRGLCPLAWRRYLQATVRSLDLLLE